MTCDLTVLVVTYNSRGVLPAFVAALDRGLEGVSSHELVIVDNASTDGTPAQAAALAPHATVVRQPRNRGYAAGVNAGVAAAAASRAVLVLNPDVELGAGCARRLLDALDEPATGAAVPRLVDPAGRLQHSLRRDPSVLRALGAALAGGARAGRTRAFGEVVTDPAAYAHPCTVDWATGAAMMLARDCLRAVGPWDESFFLYSEEVDYAQRIRDRGQVIRYVPTATAVHRGGDAPSTPHLWSLMAVNRVRLFARRHGPLASAAFWGAVTLGEAVRAVAGQARSRAAVSSLLRGLGGRLPAAGGDG